MASFFKLPSDVHKYIFESWIRDEHALLTALSALDVACCARSVRSDFLALPCVLSSPLIDHDDAKACAIKDINCYMAWLSSRRVGVRALYLSHSALNALQPSALSGSLLLPSIPSVESILIETTPCHLALQHVLCACPNARTITEVPSTAFSPLLGIWDPLAKAPLPALRALHIRTYQHSLAAVQAVFREHGASLVAFSCQAALPFDQVSTLFATCPHMKKLALSGAGDWIYLGKALKCCPQVEELELSGCHQCPFYGMVGILQHPGRAEHLKRFRVTGLTNPTLTDFLKLAEENRWLEQLQVDRWVLCRATGHVGVQQALFHGDLETIGARMTALCSVVRKLSVWGNQRPFGPLLRMAGELLSAGHLLEVMMSRVDSSSITALLKLCPTLTVVQLHEVQVCDTLLVSFSTCKALVSLSLTDCDTAYLMNRHLDPVLCTMLTVCCQLQKVHFSFKRFDLKLQLPFVRPTVSFQVLKVILDNKMLHLQELHLSGVAGLSNVDVEMFRLLAKERMLLPIPRIKLL